MTGPSEHAVVLQAASVLLQYPDARVRGALPAVRAALETLPRGLPPRRLLDLVGYLEQTPAGELEERYVAVLDRKRKCCLYLTWWTDGETRRRPAFAVQAVGPGLHHGLGVDHGDLILVLNIDEEMAFAVGDGLFWSPADIHRADD